MGEDKVQQLRGIVKQHPAIMWGSNAYDTFDADAVAEAIYNYGSWEDVTEYHRVVGLKTAGEIFERLTNKRRCNLSPKVRFFFQHYYEKHTH